MSKVKSDITPQNADNEDCALSSAAFCKPQSILVTEKAYFFDNVSPKPLSSTEGKGDTVELGGVKLKPGDLTSSISALIAIASLVGVTMRYVSDKKEARTNTKIQYLEERIRTLYGPLNELREESRLLYKIFAADLKDKYQKEKKTRFRTLTYLRQNKPDSLDEWDREILFQIIEISRKNIDFIEANGWAVESTELSRLLGELCAHFRTMELAANGKLHGAPDTLKDIVFPLETDGAIENEIRRTQAAIQELREEPGFWKRKLKWLQKVCMENLTVEYYDKHADDYYLQTNNIDMSESYRKFIHQLKEAKREGGRLLDAGCGVGRDTRHFIKVGYKVHSFDLSEKMCEITNRYPFAFCEQKSFLDLDEYEEYDGIWANASLLHVSKSDLPTALLKLTKALKVGGILFASFKTEDNFWKRDNRTFYFHSRDELERIIKEKNLGLELLDTWKAHKFGDKNKEAFESYIWVRKA